MLAVVLLSSCSKQLTTSTGDPMVREELGIDEINFEYLTIKSKIQFQEASTSKNATALIRLRKDSIIWFNLSGTLGVQGIRGILTLDSVKILNRVDKEYRQLDYDELSKEFNFKIDYFIIQAMVLGEMPKKAQENETITRRKDSYIIHQTFGDIYIDNYISVINNKVTEVNILEASTKNSMTLMYGDFQEFNNQFFPYSSFVSLIHNNEFGELETKVNITHTKVELSNKELNFPFTIPKKYARK